MARMSSKARRMAVSAVFLSIGLVLKTFFSFYIPLFGQNGIRVGLSGVFTMMPSILFGPFYGAAVSGLSDLMGYLLKPTGAYMPLLTITAALGGALRGLMFGWLRGKNSRRMRIIVAACAAAMLIIGVAGMAALGADGVDASFYERVAPDQADKLPMSGISRLLISRTANTKDPAGNLATYVTTLTVAPIACAAFALGMLILDLIAARRLPSGEKKAGLMPLLLTVMVSGVIITTLNTVILRETLYASWKLLSFYVVWVPRLIEEILVGSVKVLFMAALMRLAESRFR